MDLNISEVCKLCNLMDCKVDFLKFLSDSDVNRFREFSSGNPSSSLLLEDGLEVTQDLVDSQQRFYDDLDLYIKFLQELAKFRPLPF